jgi:signal transduction histidine kinase
MKLRQRIILALIAIAVVLIAPAVYGLFALRTLEGIAQSLRTRDAVGALALGRLQTSFGEVEHWEGVYLAVQAPGSKEQVQQSAARVEAELTRLEEGGYRKPAATARERWETLKSALQTEQSLVASGQRDSADSYRATVVNPASAAMSEALDPIGAAINLAGEQRVQRAQSVAASAVTTTLAALAFGLLLALAIAGWLTRSLLRPIRELRQGMAVVAGGDFSPDVLIPPDRSDELGDLARSFDRMTEQLAELDRLKAEFVSIASHELKTPLSVIRGYVSLLMDGIYGTLDEAQTKILVSVSDQTDRLTRLVQRLLDVTRFEAGGGRLELRSIPVKEFLDELAESFDVLAYQNEVDFRVEFADALPESIVGDPDRLNEVLGNLLSNAFKFTPRGGRIRLSAGPADDGLFVEVSDTGVGIPPDKLQKVFEKFFQVENEAQPRSVGSGLGLAIAREIVEAHGGTIAAESQPGHGTTFRVTLPQQPPLAHAA